MKPDLIRVILYTPGLCNPNFRHIDTPGNYLEKKTIDRTSRLASVLLIDGGT